MSFRVLVCDDDKPTRFVIQRLLTQRLGCEVIECCNGVEALERLGATHDIDLVILDINMPVLDGVDVVEAIRRTPQLAPLPVIMLSHERREEVVVKLIHLGIFGYVTKPPAADTLLTLVERVRRAKNTESQSTDIRLDRETPALVADGDAGYRRFFVSHAQPYGMVVPAESGLSALAAFKRQPSRLVFIGDDLGVVGRDLLIRKLREMSADQRLRIVELRDPGDQATSTPGSDDVMSRTMVLAEHRAALRRFVRATGPVNDLAAIIGDPVGLVATAAMHVFKTALDADVQTGSGEIGGVDVSATLDITLRHQYAVRLDFCFSKADAARIGARVRSVAPAAVTKEDMTAALTEILTELRGRLQLDFTARQIEFECSLPRIRHQDAMEIALPQDGHGFDLAFTAAVDGDARFTLLASVAKGAGQPAAGIHAA